MSAAGLKQKTQRIGEPAVPTITIVLRRSDTLHGSFGFSVGGSARSSQKSGPILHQHLVSRVAIEVAEQHGLQTGDQIVRINGRDASLLTHEALVQLVYDSPDDLELAITRKTLMKSTSGSTDAFRRKSLMAPGRLRELAQKSVKQWKAVTQEGKNESLKLRKHSQILEVGEQLLDRELKAQAQRENEAIKRALADARKDFDLELTTALAKAEVKSNSRMRDMKIQMEKDEAERRRLAEAEFKHNMKLKVLETRQEEIEQKEKELDLCRQACENDCKQRIKESCEELRTTLLRESADRERKAVEAAIEKVKTEFETELKIKLKENTKLLMGKLDDSSSTYDTKIAKLKAQLEDEIQETERLQALLEEEKGNVAKQELKYLQLMQTHQKTLAVTLPNYNQPWLQ
eukprot:m.153628 g.153628  ORF g.153628 m.153628 type:complete len:403 (-) comp15070_c0_seq10:430-1638(-)